MFVLLQLNLRQEVESASSLLDEIWTVLNDYISRKTYVMPELFMLLRRHK